MPCRSPTILLKSNTEENMQIKRIKYILLQTISELDVVFFLLLLFAPFIKCKPARHLPCSCRRPQNFSLHLRPSRPPPCWMKFFFFFFKAPRCHSFFYRRRRFMWVASRVCMSPLYSFDINICQNNSASIRMPVLMEAIFERVHAHQSHFHLNENQEHFFFGWQRRQMFDKQQSFWMRILGQRQQDGARRCTSFITCVCTKCEAEHSKRLWKATCSTKIFCDDIYDVRLEFTELFNSSFFLHSSTLYYTCSLFASTMCSLVQNTEQQKHELQPVQKVANSDFLIDFLQFHLLHG